VVSRGRNAHAPAYTFSIQTAAGEIRPTITSEPTATVDMGRVRLQSPNYPSGAPDGRGVLIADGRQWSFQHVEVGNPQCAIRVGDLGERYLCKRAPIGPGL